MFGRDIKNILSTINIWMNITIIDMFIKKKFTCFFTSIAYNSQERVAIYHLPLPISVYDDLWKEFC